MNGAQAAALAKQRELEEARKKEEERQRQEKRQEERKQKLAETKDMVTSGNTNPFAVVKQIKATDMTYAIALMAALLKDLIDVVQASGILYFIVIIMSLLIYIFIFFMVLLGNILGGSSVLNKLMIRQLMTIFGGTIFEMFPIISFLPVTMASVVVLYYFALSARKKAA